MDNLGSVDDMWQFWKCLFLGILEKHAPTRQLRLRGGKQNLPWIDSNIRKLMLKRDLLSRRAKKSKKVEDWASYRLMRNTVTRSLKLLIIAKLAL